MPEVNKNKAIVARWFEKYWGEKFDDGVVDELAAPDMTFNYSIHPERNGRADIKNFMRGFREAFPDLKFWGCGDLIAEGEYVVGRWEGGGTHTGPELADFTIGKLPAASGRKMRFVGVSIFRIVNGLIVEEYGLDNGVTAYTQLDVLKVA
jgi:predicted ester cyclase